MAAPMNEKEMAMEVTRLRKEANRKDIPQEAKNQLLDKANSLEYKMYEMQKKVNMAKGGVAAKKAAAKKASSRQSPVVAVMIGMTDKKKQTKMACGGGVKKGK